jgi:hypothetical protein
MVYFDILFIAFFKRPTNIKNDLSENKHQNSMKVILYAVFRAKNTWKMSKIYHADLVISDFKTINLLIQIFPFIF